MFRYRVMAVRALVLVPALVVCTWSGANGQPQDAKNPHPKQGSGIVIELDNAFIEKYMDRATMETDFRPVAFSAVHPAKNDGEIHVARVRGRGEAAHRGRGHERRRRQGR